ncbi:hypothetical protein TSOC_011060 [Tetrabaena socialis]|uniref:RNA-binding protein Tab2-like N-terminal domain-containing protein n=1 Tax=Tetrabaena socialis TaxID=47790 RepID=A0A2J7ZRP1_9CHLO|nr:hypothetical protein TSOC_011060 [Tetrabaena socialis]|eukprot:PNH02936.1 hypothetical protein TSOC_011060 [Tetrabaena socialis]
MSALLPHRALAPPAQGSRAQVAPQCSLSPVAPAPCLRLSRALAPECPAHGRATGRRAAVVAHSDTAVQLPSTSTAGSTVPKSGVWEIDFCSRPLLDERGKKVWELLICDPERTFEYSEYFPNSKINSGEVRARLPKRLASAHHAQPCRATSLKRTIERILAQPGAERPEKARFFRSQMQTIITKALTDCLIKAVPSRRCFTVMGVHFLAVQPDPDSDELNGLWMLQDSEPPTI